MQGTLTPTGDIANQAQIIQTGILTDDSYSVSDDGRLRPP